MTFVAAPLAAAAMLAAVLTDAPVVVRVPLALLVFLTLPGWSLVRAAQPGRRPGLDWAVLVVGVSVAVDLLLAQLLLALGQLDELVFLSSVLALTSVAAVVEAARVRTVQA